MSAVDTGSLQAASHAMKYITYLNQTLCGSVV